jgi:amino acid transporter
MPSPAEEAAVSATEQSRPKLVRAVTRWDLVGMAINDVIGSGVYLLPAAAAALLGVASVWAVVIAGIAVALLVLCFAEASSYFDEPGGAYLYTREAFGPFVGFEVGWMTWLARIASIAALANGFAQATSFLWPGADQGLRRALLIIVPILILAWINIVGVKAGARTAVAFVIAKTVPLLLFIGAGLFYVDWSVFGGIEAPPISSLGQAALLLMFAYAGFENTPAAAGEYRNPQRDVPFALIMMILFVTTTYTLVQVVALGTLPGLADSASPLAEAGAVFLGVWFALLMSFGAMVSIEGNIASTVLIGPRYLFALADDGFGPRFLSRIHARHHTPANAIMLHTFLALTLALSGSFVGLALLSVIARLTTYIGTALAVPFLRQRFGHRPGAVRLPGGATIPIIALALSVGLLASASAANLRTGLIALIVGVVVYRFRRPPRAEQAVEPVQPVEQRDPDRRQ